MEDSFFGLQEIETLRISETQNEDDSAIKAIDWVDACSGQTSAAASGVQAGSLRSQGGRTRYGFGDAGRTFFEILSAIEPMTVTTSYRPW